MTLNKMMMHERLTDLRQERPPHLRNNAVHPAMRERGRAIPTDTVPIVPRSPPTPTATHRIVEGRVSTDTT